MIDYNQYMYTKRERILYGGLGGAAGFVIFMLFYNRFVICLPGSVLAGVCFLKWYKHVLLEKRRWQLTIQFKDAMESLVSALVAGYSLEHAVEEAENDLRLMYDEKAIIRQEFSYMVHRIGLRVSVEALMNDLGVRSGVEDIQTFSEILTTAKKTGGNLVQVMKHTAGNITEKIEVKREIDTLVAGKKMESNCMTAIPLLMIAYLRIFSPGFLEPLYGNVMGMFVMTGALAVYVFSFWWGQRIMKIEF